MNSKQSTASAVAPTLIVVLGMHRSGTSVLTKSMETMGAEFGSRLLPPVAGDNDKGYFEDADINRINLEVMHAAGSDWHAMASVDLGAIDIHRLDALRIEAAAMLRAKCQGKIFAIKDPRISRLMPFWQPIFASLQVRVVYAISIRNPISVARSLAKRGPFPEEKAHLLWLAHTLSALEATRAETRVLISYDALLDAPQTELQRIASELGLPLIDARVEAFAEEFLDTELRHTRYTSDDLGLAHTLPRQAKMLFATLDATIRNRLTYDNAVLADAVSDARTYLNDIEPLLHYEWQLSQQLEAMKALRDEALVVLQHEREQLDTANQAKQQEVNSIQIAAATLEARLTSTQIELSDTRNSLSAKQQEIDTIQRASAALEAQLACTQVQLDHARQSLTDLLGSTSWRITTPLRTLKRLLSGG